MMELNIVGELKNIDVARNEGINMCFQCIGSSIEDHFSSIIGIAFLDALMILYGLQWFLDHCHMMGTNEEFVHRKSYFSSPRIGHVPTPIYSFFLVVLELT